MPKFIDSHDDLKLPAEVWASLAEGTRAGTEDQFGVRQIEAYHDQAGLVYCVVEAPDAEAVRKHHVALGVACGEVHPVESLL